MGKYALLVYQNLNPEWLSTFIICNKRKLYYANSFERDLKEE